MSECMKVLKVAPKQWFQQSLWVDPADGEKWIYLVDSFILRLYYILDEELAGDSDQAFAKFLKSYPDQSLIQRTLTFEARNNQNIRAPTKKVLFPPMIGNTNIEDCGVIDTFVRNTAILYKVPPNPKNPIYRQIMDGISSLSRIKEKASPRR